MEDFFHHLVCFYVIQKLFLNVTMPAHSPKLVKKFEHSWGLLLIGLCFQGLVRLPNAVALVTYGWAPQAPGLNPPSLPGISVCAPFQLLSCVRPLLASSLDVVFT